MNYEYAQARRKKLKRLPIKKADAVASARRNLTGDSTASAPSWCYRWVRQILWLAGVPHEDVPVIASARLAFLYFQKQGWEWTVDRTPNVGDIIFWVSPKHGKAGHVELYIGNGQTAGNSSLNILSEGDTEARGTRPLNLNGDWKIIRPPYIDGI